MSLSAPDSRPCRELTILVVDDEPSFRQSLAEALRDDGHPVHEYPSATALPPLGTLPPGVILLTDFEMPGRNGIDLADAFRSANPGGHAILLSAYAVPVVDGTVSTRPWLRFVSKPADYQALHQLIHEL